MKDYNDIAKRKLASLERFEQASKARIDAAFADMAEAREDLREALDMHEQAMKSEVRL